jgi:hypothetical protein
MIALNNNRTLGLELANCIDAEFGISPVPDDVAEHSNSIHPRRADMTEDRRQGLAVRVNIRDDGSEHGSLVERARDSLENVPPLLRGVQSTFVSSRGAAVKLAECNEVLLTFRKYLFDVTLSKTTQNYPFVR